MKHSIILLLLFLLSNACSLNPPEQKKPNVILIMADDMGVECLSVNGALSYHTPVLDKLAENGVRFTHCFSQPVCTPSRVKIMTGKYNSRNYIDFGYLDRREPTFGNMMKAAGYKTMVAGKWQLSGAKDKVEGYDDMERPQQFGFDEYCLWHMTKKGPRFANPRLEQNGKLLETTIDDYGPDIVSDYILDFIERNHDKPFFVYYPMILVHSPFVPTPDSPEWQDPNRRDERDNRFFKDMVEYSDKIVGKILSKLEALGIADNTVVLFTGDNGTHSALVTQTVDGPYKGGKGKMFDNGTHVPMIAYYPNGQQSGVVEEGLIEFSDFVPTLADLAGTPSPETNGYSFYNAITPGKFQPRQSIFVHYNQYPGKVEKSDGRFARTIEYKLYHDGRLYNMVEDKWEQQMLDVTKLSASEQEIYQLLKEELDSKPDYDFSVPHEVLIH